MHIKSVIASALVLALSIISTTFTLLALTSKEWSYQIYYFNDASAGLNPVNGTEGARVCTGTRSPFYRCDVPFVYPNGTCFIKDCATYKAYGNNRTSCRSAPELGLNWTDYQLAGGLMGYAQECQQVHYAGNLQIAASFFIVLGLCFALVLSVFTAILGLIPSRHAEGSQPEGEAVETREERRKEAREERQFRSRRSRNTPYVTALLLACLYTGILMQLLAQFFGVLGLTLNATPDQATAVSYRPNTDVDLRIDNFQADSWAVGKGLSTYATIAWTSAAACAAVASTVFRRPSFPKLV